MKLNLSSVCIIPARGGSKRIPEKNIRLLHGKPLIVYTIEAVLQAGCFQDVYVSSEDKRILRIAETFGIKTDYRPSTLCGDNVKAVEVIKEFLERPKHFEKWQIVSMCLPTCPFRTSDDVTGAMKLFYKERESCSRLIGVTKYEFPPQLALKKSSVKSLLDLREPEAYGFSTRSQDCEDFYYPNGSIYISTVNDFLIAKSFFGHPMIGYIMPAERSFDIDYPYQFRIAEYMMQANSENKKR